MNNEQGKETKRIKLGEKLGFLSFSGANNIIYQFRSIYHLFFLTNVLKVGMEYAGIVITIGAFWDAINDPLVGYWALNRSFKNGEKLRPYTLFHCVPWAIGVVLMFTDFKTTPIVSTILAILAYIFFELFNTSIMLPYNGMSGLATNRDSDRRSINVFRNLGGGIGSAIGSVACLPLLKLFGALDNSGNLISSSAGKGFILVSCVMGIIMIVGSVIHYFTTEERVKQVSEEDSKLSIREVIGMVVHSRSWWYNTIYIICYGVINFLLMSALTYYATYVLGSTAAATMIQASYLVASVVASFFVSVLDQKLGRRRCMMLAVAIALVGKIWFIIQPSSTGAIYMNAITVGISVTFAYVLFNTNRNNIVDIIEAKTTRRIDSMIVTTDNLVSKLVVSAVTLLSTFMLGSNGYDANLSVQPDGVISVIYLMLGIAPAVASVIMLIASFLIPIEKEFADAKTILTKAKAEE
ncbi:MAG: MFS transporter [Oscillospiraceae bacterium]|nr:MFS transporter [Oscillospiraceae bacterium]